MIHMPRLFLETQMQSLEPGEEPKIPMGTGLGTTEQEAFTAGRHLQIQYLQGSTTRAHEL